MLTEAALSCPNTLPCPMGPLSGSVHRCPAAPSPSVQPARRSSWQRMRSSSAARGAIESVTATCKLAWGLAGKESPALKGWMGELSPLGGGGLGRAWPLGGSQSGLWHCPCLQHTPLGPARLLPRLVASAGFSQGRICYRTCQKTHWPDHKALCRPENIGFPFLISVPESRLTYARLAQLLEGYAR